jgi:hypothetical protein
MFWPGYISCEALDYPRRRLFRPILQHLLLNGGEVVEHGQRLLTSVSISLVPASEDSSTKANSVQC